MASASHGVEFTEVQGDHFHGTVVAQNVGGRGNITSNIGQITISIPPDATVFDILKPYLVEGALYNSEARKTEHATTCHPDTHARILRHITRWVDTAKRPVCWLYGPAGTGKSTICHTIAERQQAGHLAATFFFSRRKGAREDINTLIPTLAYQISQYIPSIRSCMERVLRQDRTLLSQTIECQFQKLIVEPFMSVGACDRSLIIIDGLDECAARSRLMALVKLLGETFTGSNSPLQFLLASRPEPDIASTFRLYAPNTTSLWLALEDSREDVRNYLRDHLQQIRQHYETIMVREPALWPPQKDLDALVGNSDGLMVYAATLVRYMNDDQESPQVKLHRVLARHDGVDPLYEQVISEAQEHMNFKRVMGTLMYLRYPIPVAELALLLRLDVPDIRIALSRCHSVLRIPANDGDSIRPYHASLGDYLMDQERSKNHFCAPAQFHASIAVDCLRAITNSLGSKDKPTEYVCIAWYYHCSSLLSHTDRMEHLRLCPEVKAEVDAVNVNWLRWWMVEALRYAGAGYIIVKLPSAKGMPAEGRALHMKLKRMGMMWNDFLTVCGEVMFWMMVN